MLRPPLPPSLCQRRRQVVRLVVGAGGRARGSGALLPHAQRRARTARGGRQRRPRTGAEKAAVGGSDDDQEDNEEKDEQDEEQHDGHDHGNDLR